jgi:hypothetical protein
MRLLVWQSFQCCADIVIRIPGIDIPKDYTVRRDFRSRAALGGDGDGVVTAGDHSQLLPESSTWLTE